MRPANTVISFYAAMFVLPALLVAVTCLAAARLPRRGAGRDVDVEGEDLEGEDVRGEGGRG